MSFFTQVSQGSPTTQTSATAWPVRIVSGTDDRAATIDLATNAINTIDYEHHEVHAGSTFRININKDVVNGGTYNVCFTTANATKWPHLHIEINLEVEGEILFYEGITSWTGGTALTPLNADRNSATVSNITDMVFDATITLGSPTTLDHEVLGSGKSNGGARGTRAEWVLKQNTKYAIVVNNQAAGASNETNISLDWYEHTNKTS